MIHLWLLKCSRNILVVDANNFFISNKGLQSDIKGMDNRKRNAKKINLWNPEKKGDKLEIPYSYGNGITPAKKTAIEVAIKAMNAHFQCGHDAFVPFTNQKHRIEFISEDG